MGVKSKSVALQATTPTKRSAGVRSLPVYFQFDIIAKEFMEAFGNARTQVTHMGFLIADVMRANPTPVALETACIKYRHAKIFPPSAIAELLEFLREAEERWIRHRDILGGLIEFVERWKAIAEARSQKQLTSNQAGGGSKRSGVDTAAMAVNTAPRDS